MDLTRYLVLQVSLATRQAHRIKCVAASLVLNTLAGAKANAHILRRDIGPVLHVAPPPRMGGQPTLEGLREELRRSFIALAFCGCAQK